LLEERDLPLCFPLITLILRCTSLEKIWECRLCYRQYQVAQVSPVVTSLQGSPMNRLVIRIFNFSAPGLEGDSPVAAPLHSGIFSVRPKLSYFTTLVDDETLPPFFDRPLFMFSFRLLSHVAKSALQSPNPRWFEFVVFYSASLSLSTLNLNPIFVLFTKLPPILM